MDVKTMKLTKIKCKDLFLKSGLIFKSCQETMDINAFNPFTLQYGPCMFGQDEFLIRNHK